MFSEDGYLGAPNGMESLRTLSDQLNARVVAQVSSTQELVTMNKFEHECNEYLFRKCLQERISDIESWRWVLEDLCKRLEGAIAALRYEHNALRVVVQRVDDELQRRSKEASRPGAMTPQSDTVEDAILQEYNFLRDQKKKFEKMILELDEQTTALEKVRKRIEVDVLSKQQAIEVDENCATIDYDKANTYEKRDKKKRSYSPMTRWENRCYSLKKKGLCALSHALIIRQQVRGARSQLSTSAQTYASRVESTLRRRLHVNRSKLQELQWQREEATRDYKALSEELTTSEQNVLETMEKVRLMEVRLADRRQRPSKELIRDEVDKKLRDELNRLRQYLKFLRRNIDRITSLQKDLIASVAQINCVEEDISQVTKLDEERMRGRLEDSEPREEVTQGSINGTQSPSFASSNCPEVSKTSKIELHVPLSTITEDDEEDEIDDYPFDY